MEATMKANKTKRSKRTTPKQVDIHRVAVLNRGEPAVRFLRALREYNAERGTAIEAVALWTDADVGASWIRQADDAIALGPALATAADGSATSAYCDHERVIDLLVRHRCDAVWPGWGFIAEDPRFVDRAAAAGLEFIGPPAESMRLLGDKIGAKQLAEQCDVPLGPWCLVEDDMDEAALRAAGETIGYPLMAKASAGGGGRGIRRVECADDLLAAVNAARDEVRKIFGQGGLLLEKCILGARHIEVQLVAGADGKASAVGVRDCSIQRRNQKVIEEAPSPVLTSAARQQALDATVRLAEAAGYRGVGTAEFLYRPQTDELSFLEVNSRLQVEHTITEAISGCDLVHAQLDIARGLPWQPPAGPPRGHAIEVRLNAENPEHDFRPSPGIIRLLRLPSGPGIRVDCGVAEGQAIAPEFDSMIAKVIAWAPTRRQAIARLQRALRELQVVVEDGATNKAFLLDLLTVPAYVSGEADTGWLDRAVADGEFGTPTGAFEALLVAAVTEYRLRRRADIERFLAQAQDGIPQQLPPPDGLTFELRLRGRNHTIEVYALSHDRYLVGPAGALHRLTIEPTGPHAAILQIEGRRHDVLHARGRAGILVEIDGAMHAIEQSSGGVVAAPAPAMVVQVSASEGDVVAVGDRICTLEAMKMEMPVFAPTAGTVRSLLCRANEQVTAGQPLAIIDAEGEAETVADGDDAPLPTPAPQPLDRVLAAAGERQQLLQTMAQPERQAVLDGLIDEVRAVLLGHELPNHRIAAIEALLDDHELISTASTPACLRPLIDLLGAFADAGSLFDRNLLPLVGEPAAASAELAFYDFCRRHHEGADAASAELQPLMERALAWYGVPALASSAVLRAALWRLACANAHGGARHRLCSLLLRLAISLHEAGLELQKDDALREVVGRVAQVAHDAFSFVADNASQAVYVLFEQHRYVRHRLELDRWIEATIANFDDAPPSDARQWVEELIESRQPVLHTLLRRADSTSAGALSVAETALRRLYAGAMCTDLRAWRVGPVVAADAAMGLHEGQTPVTLLLAQTLDEALAALPTLLQERPAASRRVVEITLTGDAEPAPTAITAAIEGLEAGSLPADRLARLTVSWTSGEAALCHLSWQVIGTGLQLDDLHGLHPETACRIELWRLEAFELQRLEAPEHLVAFRGRARANARDERVFVFAELRDVPDDLEADDAGERLWEFERAYFEGIRIIRQVQAGTALRRRFHWNRLTFHVRPVLNLGARDVARIAHKLEAPARGAGLQKVVVRAQVRDDRSPAGLRPVELVISTPGSHRLDVQLRTPSPLPLRAMTPYAMAVVRSRRMGATYPYEIIRMLEGRVAADRLPHPDMIEGSFVELDLDEQGALVPAERPRGGNSAGVVVGLVSHVTERHPEGMERVWIASDPTRAMGALAEPECRRVIAALDLATERGIPLEWLPVSAGALISMDSGTENLDWTARVLRRIIEFTQSGGVIHVIVAAVNVGAQSYWNAEATMLMHCRGMLIMTPAGSMVLTGKKALEYSGSVAAEDERGIGGYARIMGPNGQGQCQARDLGDAYAILFEHYRNTYVVAGESHPRPHLSGDPVQRSILDHAYEGSEDFVTVGEIFDDATNPGRKRPFSIRAVMAATIDGDGGHVERFGAMADADTAVVWEARMGGQPATVIGIESRPLTRRGRIPMDGPETWTGGTLFPNSSRKVARALNAASGQRPVVVLANLSGFDGSPESLRRLQLEYGAEIGRAVVNFDGPIVFAVIGRYHGGAYVVFSKALNPGLHALALEGSYASVIGGAPAAAVVFPRLVRQLAQKDPAVLGAKKALDKAPASRRPRLREALDAALSDATLRAQGEVARQFDDIHTVERAVEVGSLDAVIPPARLRPAVIEVLQRAALDDDGDSTGSRRTGGPVRSRASRPTAGAPPSSPSVGSLPS